MIILDSREDYHMHHTTKVSELESILNEIEIDLQSTSTWKVTECIELELKKMSIQKQLDALSQRSV